MLCRLLWCSIEKGEEGEREKGREEKKERVDTTKMHREKDGEKLVKREKIWTPRAALGSRS